METNQLQNDEVEIDLKEIFFVLLHKFWIIVLAMVVCAGVAGIFTKTMITPQFKSSSMLYILTKSTSITSLADIQMGITAYKRLFYISGEPSGSGRSNQKSET